MGDDWSSVSAPRAALRVQEVENDGAQAGVGRPARKRRQAAAAPVIPAAAGALVTMVSDPSAPTGR
jgi:hypothetical protein